MTNTARNQDESDMHQQASTSRNHLVGKVVLLIGNDSADLHTLIKQLAQKGADIALVCRHLSRETINRVNDIVESLGRRFLFIEEIKYQPDYANDLVQTVVSDLGNLDIFIDLSVQENKSTAKVQKKRKPNWHFAQVVIKELARS